MDTLVKVDGFRQQWREDHGKAGFHHLRWSGITGLSFVNPRMRDRLTPFPQEEVSMKPSSFIQGLLIAENAA